MEENASDNIGFGAIQKLLFVLCGGGWAIAMGVVTSIAILINEINEEWGLSYSVLTVIPSLNMLGIFFGSYIWGTMSDKYGRMITFKKAMVMSTLALFVSIFSVNIYMLASVFFFVGFGLAGSLAVDGAVFLEYIPPSKTHLLTGMSVVCALGGMYATSFAWIFSALGVKMMWRLLLGYNAILNALIAIPRFWIKETPSFLISRQMHDEAHSVLRNLLNYSQDETSSFIKTMEIPNTEMIGIFEQVKILFKPPLKKLMILYMFV